jgi:CHAD domain-containing protein
LGRTIDRTHKLVATAHAARPDQRDQFLHEVRKSAKDVRYAAETLAPLDPKRFKHVVRDYEAIQEALGRHRDAVVTRTIYREAGARAGVRPTENGFTYGILFGLEDARAQRAIKKFERQWGALQRHRHDS